MHRHPTAFNRISGEALQHCRYLPLPIVSRRLRTARARSDELRNSRRRVRRRIDSGNCRWRRRHRPGSGRSRALHTSDRRSDRHIQNDVSACPSRLWSGQRHSPGSVLRQRHRRPTLAQSSHHARSWRPPADTQPYPPNGKRLGRRRSTVFDRQRFRRCSDLRRRKPGRRSHLLALKMLPPNGRRRTHRLRV